MEFFRLQKLNRKIAYCCIHRCSLVLSASSAVSALLLLLLLRLLLLLLRLLLLLLLLLHYVLLVGPARCFIFYSSEASF